MALVSRIKKVVLPITLFMVYVAVLSYILLGLRVLHGLGL